MTTGGYDFCPWSAVYMVKSGTISIGFSIPNLGGTLPAIPRSHSKYEYNNTHCFTVYINEMFGVEQSFAVFLHGKAASRPFKMTSEMEFFYAFNFSRGGQCQKVKGSGFI